MNKREKTGACLKAYLNKLGPLLGGLLVLMAGSLSPAHADSLNIGQPAPNFDLKDQYGKTHRLADYQGRWIVVYFYPKDDTPGCTTEACHFRDDILHLQALKAEVFGISVDSAESHAQFAKKYGLPFPLLSDSAGATAGAYGCLKSLGPFKIAQRQSFIIDPTGRIAKIYRKVDADTHSAQVIEDLKALQQAAAKS